MIRKRIIYFSGGLFSDCDFPLIRELQRKGCDIRYFIPINGISNRQGLLDFKSVKPNKGVYKASQYPELSIYSSYIDLNRVYIINEPHGGSELKHKLFWIYVYVKMLLMFPKVFHFTWQLSGTQKYPYHLPCKKVMAVYDPLLHSHLNPQERELQEKDAIGRV